MKVKIVSAPPKPEEDVVLLELTRDEAALLRRTIAWADTTDPNLSILSVVSRALYAGGVNWDSSLRKGDRR